MMIEERNPKYSGFPKRDKPLAISHWINPNSTTTSKNKTCHKSSHSIIPDEGMIHSQCFTSAMQYGQVSHGATSPYTATFNDGMSSGSRSPPSVYQHDSSSSYEDSSSSSSMNCRHSCKGSVKSFSFEYNRRAIGESFKPGMKDVPTWLKALRLHKYTEMFQEMSYDEMLNLDESELERRQVTQGARKKILQSIQKLKNRSIAIREHLRSFSQNVGCVRCAIVTLRQLLLTPIRQYEPKSGETRDAVEGNGNIANISDDNIPALLIRLLVAVSSIVFPLQNGEDVEDEYLIMMFCIYDKVANNEAFLDCQRRRAVQLKKQARRFYSPQDHRRNNNSLTHSSGRCDNCQHRNMPNNHDFLYKSYTFYVASPDHRRERNDGIMHRAQHKIYNSHAMHNAQKQQSPWMYNTNQRNANPLFLSDRIWGSCAQEARLSEAYEFANNSMPPMNTQPVHVAQFPQYRSTMSNQQMMATMKLCNNTNVTPNRNSNDLGNLNRNGFSNEEPLPGHFGSFNKRDEPIWPAAIYTTQLSEKPVFVEDYSKQSIWGLPDNSDKSDYSSASTSERSSDAGSPRSRAPNSRSDDDNLHRLLETLGSIREPWCA